MESGRVNPLAFHNSYHPPAVELDRYPVVWQVMQLGLFIGLPPSTISPFKSIFVCWACVVVAQPVIISGAGMPELENMA